MSNRLYEFLHALDATQRERLENYSGHSIGSIRHYVSGLRTPSSATAIAIEKAAARLRRSDPSLPPLGRRDLSPACRDCEYAKTCTARLS